MSMASMGNLREAPSGKVLNGRNIGSCLESQLHNAVSSKKSTVPAQLCEILAPVTAVAVVLMRAAVAP